MHEHSAECKNELRFFKVESYPMGKGDYNNSLEEEYLLNNQNNTFTYIHNRQHNTYNVESEDVYNTTVVTGTWKLVIEMDGTSVINCTPEKIEGSSSDPNEQFTQLPEQYHAAIQGGFVDPKQIDFKNHKNQELIIPYEPFTLHRCTH
ncbi:tRNA pseudouridine synthase [Acrasis kona]|uniref:tRNA pseudouridine synthase n=1 Tax=Acrasis kona TaxID=1008807 RepID=A0AAW2ZH92_9EUKA